MGMAKIVTLEVGGHLLKVTADAGFDAAIDAKVRFEIMQDKLFFFDKTNGENLSMT
jgi:hypothetical protein